MKNDENISDDSTDVKMFVEAPLIFKNPYVIRHDRFDEPFLKSKAKEKDGNEK